MATPSGPSGLNVTVWGDGDAAVFVHGSFAWGEETWREQRPPAETHRLLLFDRRGFGDSYTAGRVDFERDAADVAELLDGGAHVVGHSYGGVVSLLAAAGRTDAVRSLALIEPPAFGVARGHPAVEQLIDKIGSARTDDPSEYRSMFLRAFGFPAEATPLNGRHLEAARSSMSERPPWEADIPLDLLASAGFPTLLIRGDWCPAPDSARARAGSAFHAVCDVLEDRLSAQRAVLPAAHNPQKLGKPFNDRLRTFWSES